MGFRFKRFDYVGGVAPMTTADTSTNLQTVIARNEAICTQFAEFIIACGKGWQLDTSRNATTSDYTRIPVWNSSHSVYNNRTAPSLFFTNSTSGCKLFMCFNCFDGNTGLAIDEQYLVIDEVHSSSNYLVGGVCFSMIPSGSDSVFGNAFGSSFLPSDATLIRGTHNLCVEYSRFHSFIEKPYSNYSYSYGLFVSEFCIGLAGSYSSTTSFETLAPGYFVGRVIGTLAHESDINLNAKYGSISFSSSYTSNNYPNEFRQRPKTSETGLDRYGYPFTSEIILNNGSYNYAQIFKENGDYTEGLSGVNVRFFGDVYSLLGSSNVISPAITGNVRWFPYQIASCASDLSTNGIVPGDGFKGYLDTNLFRCGLVTLNQLYNNGTFCGWNYMLMIGWDPSNTDSL